LQKHFKQSSCTPANFYCQRHTCDFGSQQNQNLRRGIFAPSIPKQVDRVPPLGGHVQIALISYTRGSSASEAYRTATCVVVLFFEVIPTRGERQVDSHSSSKKKTTFRKKFRIDL
jgi:hypothetical protein